MLKHPERISYDTLKAVISNLNEPEKGLAALAYATGSRVSELTKIKKKDIRINLETPEYLSIDCPVLKKNHKPKDPKKLAKWKFKNYEREALVRLDETWLIEPILKKRDSLANPEDILYPFYRVKVFRMLKKAVVIDGEPINPHGFRHLRATHLRKNFGFDPYQLQKFFKWSSIEPSSFYVGLDNKEIRY